MSYMVFLENGPLNNILQSSHREYRITLHVLTGTSASELNFGRYIRDRIPALQDIKVKNKAVNKKACDPDSINPCLIKYGKSELSNTTEVKLIMQPRMKNDSIGRDELEVAVKQVSTAWGKKLSLRLTKASFPYAFQHML